MGYKDFNLTLALELEKRQLSVALWELRLSVQQVTCSDGISLVGIREFYATARKKSQAAILIMTFKEGGTLTQAPES